MKAATFMLLLLFCGAVLGAQTTTTPPADIKIKLSSDGTEYCQGPSAPYLYVNGIAEGANDIRLRLKFRLYYVSYRKETNILPPQSRLFTRMIVPGQNQPTILRDARGPGANLNAVLGANMSLPASTFSIYNFSILTPQNPAAPELLQCLSAKDPGCISDQVTIAILDRSSGLDLRGKTVQIMMTREHTLAAEPLQKLNDKWKQYGTLWSGVVDAEPLTLHIPDNPSPRDCRQ